VLRSQIIRAMQIFLGLNLLLASVPAPASIPTGKKYGSWQIFSISSLSGTEGNDASVIMSQGDELNVLEARWTQGRPIKVSMSMKICTGDDDFYVAYYVEPKRWLQQSNEAIQQRLRADMTTWLEQARFACGANPAIEAFKFDGLDKAVTDFTDRLHYFAGDLNAQR